jgi:hypothetical protein
MTTTTTMIMTGMSIERRFLQVLCGEFGRMIVTNNSSVLGCRKQAASIEMRMGTDLFSRSYKRT